MLLYIKSTGTLEITLHIYVCMYRCKFINGTDFGIYTNRIPTLTNHEDRDWQLYQKKSYLKSYYCKGIV